MVIKVQPRRGRGCDMEHPGVGSFLANPEFTNVEPLRGKNNIWDI